MAQPDILAQAVLLVFVNVACAAWLVAKLWRRRKAGPSAQHRREQQQAGHRWRVASAVAIGAALAGHLGSAQLRIALGDKERGGSSLCDALSTALCLLLLALHWAWQRNERLWQLSTPVGAFMALEMGALAEAVHGYQHRAAPQAAATTWVAAHYEAAALALAVVNSAALAASTACLLAASAGLGAGRGRREDGDAAEPLLGGEEGRRKRRRAKGSTRMRLISGTLRYVVPDTPALKIRLLACFGLLMVGRCVNILLPVAYKHVIDRLAAGGAAAAAAASARAGGGMPSLRALCAEVAAARPTFRDVFFPWIAAYLALAFLQGTSGKGGIGFLGNVRDLLWIPLQQRACRRVSLDVFAHLLRLDHAFHLHRNTGKVMRILDRGTSSIQDVMQVVLFSLAPQLVDVLVACVYMAVSLQAWTAVVVAVTVLTYIPITFIITEFRGKVRKHMNRLDNEKEGKATDMLLNYETVKLFSAEGRELRGYGAAIDAFQAQEYLQLACISLLNIAQSALVFVGLALGLVVCVRGIVDGSLTVGDAVLFLSLMSQLVAPLSFFGSYYRQIQKGLIDMESMFELLDTAPAVDDAPGAPQLAVGRGAVAFDRVSFSYTPGGPAVLRNVSFSIEGGKTVALVGATGSGKSTCLRLLLRFWDPSSGRVLVDGQDVRRVAVASLRRAVAVVPQDTVLFNDTIAHNIRYGRPGASEAEVEGAAQVAHIHEAIVRRFPEGYATLVGERGLRLSGGEKQRVAFARAVLRRPAILVLDEATSALDSLTERMIQESLAEVRASCTTIIVAHRLSTVADAHLILVFDAGSVVESGSHADLLARGGRYAEMWRRQQEATPLCGASQQAEAPPALELGEGEELGLRLGLGHISRATSCTATERGDDDEEDEEDEDEEVAALRARAAADLSSIAEEADEEAQQRPPPQPAADEPSPPRAAAGEAQPAQQQTPARPPQPAEEHTPPRAPPAPEGPSPARQSSPFFSPASRMKPGS